MQFRSSLRVLALLAPLSPAATAQTGPEPEPAPQAEVVRLTDGALQAHGRHIQIAAPPLPGLSPDVVAASVAGEPVGLGGVTWEADPAYGWSCWIPRR